MKKTGLGVILVFLLLGGGLVAFFSKPELISPLALFKPADKVNYAPYSFANLAHREYFPSEIKLEKNLKENTLFSTYLFSFSVDGRKITGAANFPKKKEKLPIAILVRGWVDKEIYQPGMGTQKMADFLAENGFLTLAPDLLGYGGSDSAFSDTLETRFFRPITVITLLRSLDSLPQADPEKVVMWGHSNGGQIVLSVLEITQEPIPTSLWAPVSAPFPDAVLHFAAEMEDGGEKLKKVIGEFKKEYDPADFSIASHFDQIKAPLIVHQGGKDESLPPEWNDELAKQLRFLDKTVDYYRYPNENHNFTRGSASLARSRDLDFFLESLDKNSLTNLR